MTIQQDYAVKPSLSTTFTSTGDIGPSYIPSNMMGVLRVVISNVGGGNEVLVRGRIKNETTWTTLSTITGPTTGTNVDISVYDELSFNCTVYSASGGTPQLIASGFLSDDSTTILGTVTANQGTPNSAANRWPVQLTDGTDLSLITAAGELNVLATAQPGVDIGDVTVNNAAGASAVNIQDGGNSITVDNAVLSVVGGGTEATAQRVTIASDSTGVLSVDDNGGSLTIDGTVAATQSGTWNINNVSGTVSLPTGAATLSEQQTQTASLSVIDDWDESDRAKVNPIVGQAGVQGGSGTVSSNTQRVVLATDVALPTGTNTIGTVNAQGTGANGSAIGSPVSVAFQNISTGLRAMPNTFNFGGVEYQLNLVPDLTLQFLQYQADGAMRVSGNVDHDATDLGSPLKIGGKTTSLTGEPTAVSASGDRADAYFDTKGYQHVKTNTHRTTITTLHSAVTFNNTTTSSNSSSVDLTRYRSAMIYLVLTKANTPTSISIVPQFSPDAGTTWCDFRDWEWSDLVYAAAQIPLNECLTLNATNGGIGSSFRLRAVATGTTASNTITLTSYIEGLT